MGSASNAVALQVGGALGVAVIGSMLSTRYQDHMTTALAGAPAGNCHAGHPRLARRCPRRGRSRRGRRRRPARAFCPRRVHERQRDSTGGRRRRRPRRCRPGTRAPAVAGVAGLTGSSAAEGEHRAIAERSCHGGNQEGYGQPGEARRGRSPSRPQGFNPATAIQATAAGVGSRAGQYPRTCCTGAIVARVLLLLTQRFPPAVAVAVLTAHVTELRDRDCCSHGVLSGGERTFSSGGLGGTQAGERVTK